MSSQTLNLGSGFTISSGVTSSIFKSVVAGPVNSALVEDANDNPLYTAFVSVIIDSSSTSIIGRVALNFGTVLGSEDLTSAWESYVSAVKLAIQGGSSVTVVGPNHPNSTLSDTGDPYQWRTPNYAAVAAWAAQVTTSSVILLTLNDGVTAPPPTPDPLEITASLDGNLSGSIDSSVELGDAPPDPDPTPDPDPLLEGQISLGSGFTITTNSISKNVVAGPIDETLVEDDNDNPLYTKQLLIYLANDALAGYIGLQFGTGAVENLTSTWENYVGAVKLEIQGGLSITVAGPTHPNGLTSDSSEPYLWKPFNHTALAVWAAQVTSSSVILLTLADEVIPDSLEITASLDGSISGSINSNLELSSTPTPDPTPSLSPLKFTASLDGNIFGSIESDVELGLVLNSIVNLDGSLGGIIDASLGITGVYKPLINLIYRSDSVVITGVYKPLINLRYKSAPIILNIPTGI